MLNIDPENMQIAIDDLLQSLGCRHKGQGANSEATLPPDKIDRTARAISACLKTLNDIHAYNKGIEVSREKARYTAYEDLPPPSPEDRDRILSELMARYDRVHDAKPN